VTVPVRCILESGKFFWEVIKDHGGIVTASVLSLASLVVSVAAFLGKRSFEELSARNKIKRDFADATGKKIAELANQHYWPLPMRPARSAWDCATTWRPSRFSCIRLGIARGAERRSHAVARKAASITTQAWCASCGLWKTSVRGE